VAQYVIKDIFPQLPPNASDVSCKHSSLCNELSSCLCRHLPFMTSFNWHLATWYRPAPLTGLVIGDWAIMAAIRPCNRYGVSNNVTAEPLQ